MPDEFDDLVPLVQTNAHRAGASGVRDDRCRGPKEDPRAPRTPDPATPSLGVSTSLTFACHSVLTCQFRASACASRTRVSQTFSAAAFSAGSSSGCSRVLGDDLPEADSLVPRCTASICLTRESPFFIFLWLVSRLALQEEERVVTEARARPWVDARDARRRGLGNWRQGGWATGDREAGQLATGRLGNWRQGGW